MFHSIVVGTDGSETANAAVVRAATIAKLTSASLMIVSAYRPEPAPKEYREAVEQLAESGAGNDLLPYDPTTEVEAMLASARTLAEAEGATVVTQIEDGDPADSILEVAERIKADLIVVGNKGMQRRIFGSVPNSIAHQAHCDVLIVHTT